MEKCSFNAASFVKKSAADEKKSAGIALYGNTV